MGFDAFLILLRMEFRSHEGDGSIITPIRDEPAYKMS